MVADELEGAGHHPKELYHIMQTDIDNNFDLSGEAQRSTVGAIAAWLGWLLLAALAVVTAVHAITLVQATMHLSSAGGNIFNIVRIGGVVLVELFAVVTAVLLATHRLRARQKPAAMAVEATWLIFAAVNLISSFAVEAGGELPQFVGVWITYGLPVSALVMGALFYLVLRLDPDASRADDEAETLEMFARVRHAARQEVLASPQMRATIRQAEWMRLPAVVGRQMNLTQRQIEHLVRQAPELLDLNGNGIADIHEDQPEPPRRVPLVEMKQRIAESGEGPLYVEPLAYSDNGHGSARPTQRPPGR